MWESSVYRSIFAEGQAYASREAAIALLKQGTSIEIINRATGLSIETIQILQKEQEN